MAKQKNPTDGANVPSVSSYFRKLFAENPRLLRSRTNTEVVQRWLGDHPGEKEMPRRVKYAMTNVKSLMRRKGRKKRAARYQAEQLANPGLQPERRGGSRMALLEEMIDECLLVAKSWDRAGLESVIRLLRQARNQVVWKMGKSADK